MYVLNGKTHMFCNEQKQKQLCEKHNMLKTQGKMQNRPKHMIIYSQDEWHQGYNKTGLSLVAHRLA